MKSLVVLLLLIVMSCTVQRKLLYAERSEFSLSKLDSVCTSNEIPSDLGQWRSSYFQGSESTRVIYMIMRRIGQDSTLLYHVELRDTMFVLYVKPM